MESASAGKKMNTRENNTEGKAALRNKAKKT